MLDVSEATKKNQQKRCSIILKLFFFCCCCVEHRQRSGIFISLICAECLLIYSSYLIIGAWILLLLKVVCVSIELFSRFCFACAMASIWTCVKKVSRVILSLTFSICLMLQYNIIMLSCYQGWIKVEVFWKVCIFVEISSGSSSSVVPSISQIDW